MFNNFEVESSFSPSNSAQLHLSVPEHSSFVAGLKWSKRMTMPLRGSRGGATAESEFRVLGATDIK